MPEEGGSARGREASEAAGTAVIGGDCESIQYTHRVPAGQRIRGGVVRFRRFDHGLLRVRVCLRFTDHKHAARGRHSSEPCATCTAKLKCIDDCRPVAYKLRSGWPRPERTQARPVVLAGGTHVHDRLVAKKNKGNRYGDR